MTHKEFVDKTIKMIKLCECNDYSAQKSGFKLRIEKNKIKSITITAQVLLIFEQLYGYNFMYNYDLRNKFNFEYIKNYLLEMKLHFTSYKSEEYSNIVVNRCAYCGIGLSLLNEEKAANDLADLLCENMINNEYAWGMRLTDSDPDILSTYIVTMLLNRLHRAVQKPSFINDLMNEYSSEGIPYNSIITEYKYVEALTIALYMDKNYYMKEVENEKIKIINNYYYNGVESICEAKEAYFKEHPCNQWRIYGFGLAASIVYELNSPFCEFTLEKLTEYFDKPQTNIPYVLEICRMYNAIKENIDPFKMNRIMQEMFSLIKTVESLEKNGINNLEQRITDLQDYNREITIKIPIATAFVALYFLIVGVVVFLFSRKAAINILNIKDFNDLYIAIDLVISILIPTIGFVFRKTRVLMIKAVDKFYKKFNVIRDN